MKRWLGVFVIGSMTLGSAEAATIAMTIEKYVDLAIEKGIQGRSDAMLLEQAGYTHDAALLSTEAPSFTLNQTYGRGESSTKSILGNRDGVSNSKATTLSASELTPLGTDIKAAASWQDSGGTFGPSDPIAKPGLSATVTQPLYIFVRNSVLRSRKESDLAFANAKNSYEQAVMSIRSQARSNYYTVMQDSQTIQVDQRLVESSRKLLAITEALVHAGKSAPIDTARTKITLQQNERQLQNDTVLRNQAMLNAKNFVYLPLDANIVFTTELQYSPFVLSLNRLEQYALLHNPNLQTKRRTKELRRLDFQASVEPTRPTFNLTGGLSSAEQPNVSVNHSWNLGFEANWLFFDSFVTDKKARSARINYWLSDLDLQDAERSLMVTVKNTYADIKRTQQQIQNFQASRDQAQKNVEILRLRFQNGMEKLLDVFDAETQVRSLDSEYLGLLVQFNTSKDRMSEALGVDVDTLQ